MNNTDTQIVTGNGIQRRNFESFNILFDEKRNNATSDINYKDQVISNSENKPLTSPG